VLAPRNPIVGNLPALCARAASGDAAAPPRAKMNSRRFMPDIAPASRLPLSFYLGFTLTESARQVLGTDLNRSEIGPFKQIKRLADRYPDATIEPTSAKDRVWHEADFQNGSVRAVGCSGRQSDVKKRPLGLEASLPPAHPAWLK
jgi:hypothetical protein